MIERYAIKEIEEIFSLKNRYDSFWKVELAALEGYVKLKTIPAKDYLTIKKNAKVDVNLINKLELEYKHDIVAFTRTISTTLGEESRWVHYNLTSNDIVDTALSLCLKDANEYIRKDLLALRKVLIEKAKKYKFTPVIGRTHGIHGEITSFGLKWLLFLDELNRDIERFEKECKYVEVIKLSGAVGNYSSAPYELEKVVAKILGLNLAKINTQVVSRDRLAGYVSSLALISSLVEKIATELRHLARTEVNEVNEFFSKNQKGSSAMPHKRNPIGLENVCGLSRLVKNYVGVSLENNVLWHERDISHSSNERVYLPDSIGVVCYTLRRLTNIIDKLNVNEDRMLENIHATFGVVFSGRILNYVLDNKKIKRELVYDNVQQLAFRAINEKIALKKLMSESPFFKKILTKKELDSLFDYKYAFKYVNNIYKEMGI